jgi:predicted N-acetyltransferase YhbS
MWPVEQDEIINIRTRGGRHAVHYIDPVVVAASRKQRGLGRAVVELCLGSLAESGVSVVGATITDGNTASEQLFTRPGFSRCGEWS